MHGTRLLTAIAFLATAAVAADRPYLPEQPGQGVPWRFTASSSSVRVSKATPAEAKAIEESGKRLDAIIRATPVLASPRGFIFFTVGVLMEPDPLQARVRGAATLPLDLWIRFGAPHYFERDGRPTTSIADEHLNFYFNDIRPVILDHNITRRWEDGQGDLYVQPLVTGEIGGYPIYGDLLAITRPGESIWAPVAVERFMKVWLADLRKYGGVPQAAESAYAALDAAGRKAPACVLGAEKPGMTALELVPAGTAGCRPIVQANLGILSPKLPRGAVQLITVENIQRCRNLVKTDAKQKASPGECNANLELVRQIDWKRVAALLAPAP